MNSGLLFTRTLLGLAGLLSLTSVRAQSPTPTAGPLVDSPPFLPATIPERGTEPLGDDYYQILGVKRTATPDEIKRAHRRLARRHHPDLHPSSAAATSSMQKIAEAYEVLSDPEKRLFYDQTGTRLKKFKEDPLTAEVKRRLRALALRPREEGGQGMTDAADVHFFVTYYLERFGATDEHLARLDGFEKGFAFARAPYGEGLALNADEAFLLLKELDPLHVPAFIESFGILRNLVTLPIAEGGFGILDPRSAVEQVLRIVPRRYDADALNDVRAFPARFKQALEYAQLPVEQFGMGKTGDEAVQRALRLLDSPKHFLDFESAILLHRQKMEIAARPIWDSRGGGLGFSGEYLREASEILYQDETAWGNDFLVRARNLFDRAIGDGFVIAPGTMLHFAQEKNASGAEAYFRWIRVAGNPVAKGGLGRSSRKSAAFLDELIENEGLKDWGKTIKEAFDREREKLLKGPRGWCRWQLQ